MTATTNCAPVRCVTSGTRASDPSLDRKAGTVIHIMPQLAALWRKRHATRDRLARVELELVGLSAQVTADSILLGTAATPAVITAQTRRSDEAACAALAELIWTPAERLEFGTLMPAPELEPAMADVRSCAKCGWTGTGGSCWCPRRTS